ncbi:MAG: hypothetical protein WCZ08_00530 [Parcubacteria group bacterium]
MEENKMASKSDLGEYITQEGVKIPLREYIKKMESIMAASRVSSQGLRLVKAKNRQRIPVRHKVRTGRVRVLSREEIILEEILRFSINKPMIIIGFVMILMELDYYFDEINPVDLSDLLQEMGFEKISLTDAKRVLEKICRSDLLEHLIAKSKLSLIGAYKLYLG